MKKMFLLILCAVFVQSGFSQKKEIFFEGVVPSFVKVAEPSGLNKPTENVSKEVIWSEDFANGLPAGWLTQSVGNFCGWQYTTQGPQGAFSIGVPKINSTSSSNGFLIMDADFCNATQPYQQINAIVQTPRIALPGMFNVRLAFEHNFRYCCDPAQSLLQVEVSNDSLNWVVYDVRNGLSPNNTSANPVYQTVNISAVAGGQSKIWVRFRMAGVSHYWWMIDDIKIETFISNDLELEAAGVGGYSRIPYGQVPNMEMKARVGNKGGENQNQVKVNYTINDGFFEGQSVALETLLSGQNHLFEMGQIPALAGKGVYDFVFTAMQQQTDELPENNSATVSVWITDSVYSRDSYDYQGVGLWNGTGQAFKAGNIFSITEAMDATSLSFVVQESTQAGAEAVVYLYGVDGNSFTEVAASAAYTILESDIPAGVGFNPIAISIPFSSPVNLTPGQYLAAVGLSGAGNYSIATGRLPMTPAGAAYYHNGSAWSQESQTPMIRLNFGENVAECTPIVNQTVVNDVCNTGSGMAQLKVLVGTPPFEYVWSTSPAQQGPIAVNLQAGTYQVTVSDAAGCEAVIDVEVGNDPLSANLEITNAACTSPTGRAKVTPINGTPPYQYLWNTVPPQITHTATNLMPGTYSVQVTDATGCNNVFQVVIGSNNHLGMQLTAQNALCGSSTGSATVSIQSGMPPFTYTWNTDPVQNTATITGLTAGMYAVTVTDATGCGGQAEVSVGNSNLVLQAQLVVTHASCNLENGSIEVQMQNGTPPYTYLWDGGQSTLVLSDVGPGTYAVEFTDANGCYGSKSAVVQNEGLPPVIEEIVVVNPEGCGNASGTASVVMQGAGPFTYSWSTGASTQMVSDLSSGVYQVTMTSVSNNCAVEADVFVSDADAPVISGQVEHVGCYGLNTGSISVSLEGSSGEAAYLWSNGAQTSQIDELFAGWYFVTVTENNCQSTNGFLVEEPEQLRVVVSSVAPVCYDNPVGAIYLSVNGGTAPYTYQWSNGGNQASVFGLSGGNYSVTITDAQGCIVERAVNLFEPQQIVVDANIIHTTPDSDNGQISLQTSGGAGGFTYLWSTGSEQAMISNLAVGTYSVTITDASSCKVYYTYYIGFTGMEPESKYSAAVYPNPASDHITVQLRGVNDNQIKMELVNLNGQALKSMDIAVVSAEGEYKLDVSGLKPGVYVLKLYFGRELKTIKIVKS